MGSIYNKIITTVNSITEDYSLLPRQSECIVIDTCNNRIGINNFNPQHSIDISYGDIKCGHLIINGDASINNFKNIHLDNKIFAYKHITNNEIRIESSNNKIIFDGEVEFKQFPQMPLFTGPVAQYDGKLDICYTIIQTDVSFGGGHITNTVIGKSGLDVYLPNVAYFTDVCINTLYIQDNIFVDKNIQIGENLIIKNNVDICNNLIIYNSLDVYNDIYSNGKLLVYDDITTNQNIFIKQNLDLCGSAIIYGNMNIFGELIVNDDVSVNKNIVINKNAKINENVEINGNIILAGDITLTGLNKYYYGDGSKLINVGKDALILYNDASFTYLDICQNVTISNELLTYGDVSFASSLYVSGMITGAFKLQIDNVAEFNSKVDIDELEVNTKSLFKGDVFMNSFENTFGVGKDTSFNACFINVEKDTNIDNDLLVKNKADISGMEISNNLLVHLDSRMNNKLDVSSVEISNNLFVHINSRMNNKLDVSGVEISNNLIVHKNTTIDKKLDVENIEVSNNLFVHIDSRMNNKLDVSSVEISNNLIVHINTTIDNKLDVSGVEVSNNLFVHFDSRMNNKLDVSGIEISNNLFVHVDSRMNNKLDVSGLEISNNLLVHVDSRMNNKLDVSGIEISNNLLVHVDSRMNNKLDVSGVEISNNLIVYNNTSINNLLDVSGIVIYNDISFNGYARGDGSLLTNVGKDALTRYNDGSFNNFDISGDIRFFNTGSLLVNCLTDFNNEINMNTNHLKNIKDLTGERIFISKDSSFNGSLYVEKDVSFNKNLYVHGTAVFNSEFTLNDLNINNKTTTNDLTILNELKSNNNNIFYKNIDASSIDVSNTLTSLNSIIRNKSNINNLESNTLKVNNTSIFNGGSTFNENVYVNKNIDISGYVNQTNLISFKLKGTGFHSGVSNQEYIELTNKFRNNNNIAGCYINGINDLTDSYSGFNVKISGIYNITFNIKWKFDAESVIGGTLLSIALVPINTYSDSNHDLYDENYSPTTSISTNYYEDFAYNSFGPLNDNTFKLDDIDGAVFHQSINENIYLKKNTTLRAYIKTYNANLESTLASNELKIDIDLGKSSWGVTFINPL